MPSNENDIVWLDARHSLTLVELADQSGLSETEVTELVECGVFTPVAAGDPTTAGDDAEGHRFSADVLSLARTAARLRDDFDLPSSGLTLAVRLLDRIRELEAEVQALQARMPRYRG